MELTPGFLEFYEQAIKLYNVEFATARINSKESTKKWIKKYFDNAKLHFAEYKTDVFFDFLIDDYEKEIIKAVEKERIGILFLRPWNNSDDVIKKLTMYKNAYSVNSFKNLWDLLRK